MIGKKVTFEAGRQGVIEGTVLDKYIGIYDVSPPLAIDFYLVECKIKHRGSIKADTKTELYRIRVSKILSVR